MDKSDKPSSQAELARSYGTFHHQPEKQKPDAAVEQASVDAFKASNIAGMWVVGSVADKLPRNVGPTGPINEASNGKVVDIVDIQKAPKAASHRLRK